MEWALGDLKAGVSSGHEAGKYQADIEAAEQETYEWLSTRAEALGMPEEDARNFAENASQTWQKDAPVCILTKCLVNLGHPWVLFWQPFFNTFCWHHV